MSVPKSSLLLLTTFVILALLVVVGSSLWQREQTMPQVKTPPRSPSQIQHQTISSPTSTPTLRPSPDQGGTWKTYHNEKYGFEIKYPPGWSTLKSDGDNLTITNGLNSIALSVLDFRPPSSGSFEDWVHEGYSLITFHGRVALRWYTRSNQSGNFYGTEEFVIPSQKRDRAINGHLTMKKACDSCIQIFNQLADSLVFKEEK